MEWYVITVPILIGCIFVGVIGFSIWCALKQNKSIKDRARKIDPTVKTLAEAQYVLSKDIAQSMGKMDDNKQ